MDIHAINKKRCITALILCSLVFITVCIAVLVGVTLNGDYVYIGLENMRYFTYESNIFAGLSAFLCIPFQIDGLRNNNYHLPRWLVNLLYISACTVTITLLLSIVFVLPYKGFYLTYIDKCNYFFHLISPILAIISFIFINDDHELKKNTLAYAFIPLVVYAIIYLIEVFFVKNWADHYHIVGVISPALAVIMVVSVYFGIAYLIRKLHNLRHKKAKEITRDYYMNSHEVSYQTIEEAIKNLAISNRKNDKGGDVIVPRRIILMMDDKYQSGKCLKELCEIYIKHYL